MRRHRQEMTTSRSSLRCPPRYEREVALRRLSCVVWIYRVPRRDGSPRARAEQASRRLGSATTTQPETAHLFMTTTLLACFSFCPVRRALSLRSPWVFHRQTTAPSRVSRDTGRTSRGASRTSTRSLLNQDPYLDESEVLRCLNDYRSQHGAPPLRWSPVCARHAQKRARHEAGPHAEYGENLARSTSLTWRHPPTACIDSIHRWQVCTQDITPRACMTEVSCALTSTLRTYTLLGAPSLARPRAINSGSGFSRMKLKFGLISVKRTREWQCADEPFSVKHNHWEHDNFRVHVSLLEALVTNIRCRKLERKPVDHTLFSCSRQKVMVLKNQAFWLYIFVFDSLRF